MKLLGKPKGSYAKTGVAKMSSGLAMKSGKMWPKMGSVMPNKTWKK
jgi:hypothetical protein